MFLDFSSIENGFVAVELGTLQSISLFLHMFLSKPYRIPPPRPLPLLPLPPRPLPPFLYLNYNIPCNLEPYGFITAFVAFRMMYLRLLAIPL
jgi:hypothetical protein